MAMETTKNYQVEEENVNGVDLKITTYQIGEQFYCHIENKDPGAVIARAEGAAREEARKLALMKATKRLQQAR